MEMIRKAVFSGRFYPENKDILSKMIDNLLEKAKKVMIDKKLKALIVPHAGHIYSGIVAASGYRLLKGLKFKKVILLGPSHYFGFEGAAVSIADNWETPLGSVNVQRLKSDYFIESEEPHIAEHSIEVQIPFLQKVLTDFSIIPISIGEANFRKMANSLIPLIDDSTLLVISSDLSHYYSYEKAIKIDSFANEFIPKLDTKMIEEKVEACGKTGILTAVYLAKKLKWSCKKIDYRNSGDTAGNKMEVVGYGCYVFF